MWLLKQRSLDGAIAAASCWRPAGLPIARATSGDSGWVYTLYNCGTSHAFVHALDTKHRTARCIDLPWHGKDRNALELARLVLRSGTLVLSQPRVGVLAAIDPPLVRGRREACARRVARVEQRNGSGTDAARPVGNQAFPGCVALPRRTERALGS